MFRKGTMLIRDISGAPLQTQNPSQKDHIALQKKSKRQVEREEKKRNKAEIVESHDDIIGDNFWRESYKWLS